MRKNSSHKGYTVGGVAVVAAMSASMGLSPAVATEHDSESLEQGLHSASDTQGGESVILSGNTSDFLDPLDLPTTQKDLKNPLESFLESHTGIIVEAPPEPEPEPEEEPETVESEPEPSPPAQNQNNNTPPSKPKSNKTPNPSENISDVVGAAKSVLGVPYLFGGNTPAGFDCSGLTQWAFAQAGISLPRVAGDQGRAGTAVSISDAKPGDLVVWDTRHTAIYVGNGQLIHAPTAGKTVSYVSFSGMIQAMGEPTIRRF